MVGGVVFVNTIILLQALNFFTGLQDRAIKFFTEERASYICQYIYVFTKISIMLKSVHVKLRTFSKSLSLSRCKTKFFAKSVGIPALTID